MSRKERIKNALGIPYYPWSSDEEEDDESKHITKDVHLLGRQPSEPRISVADMPGTSGQLATQSPTAFNLSTPPANQQRTPPANQQRTPPANQQRTPPANQQRTPSMSEAHRRTMVWVWNHKMHTSRYSSENVVRDTPSIHSHVIPDTVSSYTGESRLYHVPSRLLLDRPYSYRSNSSCNPFNVPRRSITREQMNNNIRELKDVTRFDRMIRARRAPTYNACQPVNPPRDHLSNEYENDLEVGPPVEASFFGALDVHGSTVPQRTTNAHVNENLASPMLQLPDALDVNHVEEETDQVDQPQAASPLDERVSMKDEIVVIDEGEPDAPADEAMPDADPNGDGEGNEVIRIKDDTWDIAKQENKPGPEDADHYAAKELNHNLLRLLECPVCLEWMEPPMTQCRRGHLVCCRCRVRLTSCPVCRTTFSSVRNRAMEGDFRWCPIEHLRDELKRRVRAHHPTPQTLQELSTAIEEEWKNIPQHVAEMVRYPCRHGCGREVHLRRRNPHEGSCPERRYSCPAPACAGRPPLPHHQLSHHFQSKHMSMLKLGRKQKFVIKVNVVQREHWLLMGLQQIFHVHIDVRSRWLILYVTYIGPKRNASDYTYEVTLVGKNKARKMVYKRSTHSDLENAAQTVTNQDCFYLTLEEARNFLRVKNRRCESDQSLNISVELARNTDSVRDDSDQ